MLVKELNGMTKWIWYPGDYEIYHGMCQNFDREERGYFWPAYWKIDDCRHLVKFSAKYDLKEETQIKVAVQGTGYIAIKWEVPKRPGVYFNFEEKKYPLNQTITCPARTIIVEVVVGNKEGLPCAFVEGDIIFSGDNWRAEDFINSPLPVGYSEMYTRRNQNPMKFEFSIERCNPVKVEEMNHGILYDFGREITAETLIQFIGEKKALTLCYGESKEEALDKEQCYQKHVLDIENRDILFGRFETEQVYRTKMRAFRYIFVPDEKIERNFIISADYKYVDFGKRSSFYCNDELLNQIWAVADRTFRLASGIFFIDGVKRDRWIWSGDTYQSYYINQYSFADKEICKRTILALRGNDPVVQHINTILDYSLYWIISIDNYYKAYGDIKFVEMIYLKMNSMMKYCMKYTDEHGFIYGRMQDWVFIDWANIDQGEDKIISEEQMLFVRCYEALISIRKVLGFDIEDLEKRLKQLKTNIWKFFWDEEKKAFIDSYSTGNRHVSRHSNIFAIIFGIATGEQANEILENVLENPEIDEITTPYFKFYELEAYAKMGKYKHVMRSMKEYWGGMLNRGAQTFWEEYRPEDSEEEQYGMYGDKYGKSLCHAWGANPLYLIGRYCMGIECTAPGYQSFVVEPQLSLFDHFEVEYPLNEGNLYMKYSNCKLEVLVDISGGTLCVNGKKYILKVNQKICVEV